ncbi:succinylglutamate desuccinylase [Shewanella sp. NIFS-20-20]|uniref:succinylglutamate desuccinylase n=1 Tax=Shewanella sp. NIFS-20-20 TaxID=2853806 RepID=UPI001C4929BE|nr:succinylglutamate desuccinylase [Shewanella sp. NIFS-20-20]MBV7315205.1 succinylglutamate desuccinylase [Shewanella sp. NIFS-20-20]
MLKTLRTSLDFLAISLANPFYLAAEGPVTLDNGVRLSIWDTGVLLVEPADGLVTTTDLVLSSGVHGNETAPIELCNRLIADIVNGAQEVKQRMLFIFGNPQAIHHGTRIVEENLNRLFSGEHSKMPGLVNKERHRAKALEGYIRRFYEQVSAGERIRLHYDLHTAIRDSVHPKFAIYPFPDNKPYYQSQLHFLQQAGVDTVLFHNAPTTTFSYFSAHEFDAHAFTIELGKVLPMGQNDLTQFADFDLCIRQIITAQPAANAIDMSRMNLYQVHRSIVKHHKEFSLNFAKDVSNFSRFSRGEILAFDGEQAIAVEQEFEAIVFPNADVPIGQRAVICLSPAKDLTWV